MHTKMTFLTPDLKKFRSNLYTTLLVMMKMKCYGALCKLLNNTSVEHTLVDYLVDTALCLLVQFWLS